MRHRVFAVVVASVVVAAGFVVAAAGPVAASYNLAWNDQIAGWDRSSSPTIADVNGDGVADIVIGHQDGQLRVLDGRTGGNVPGWPQSAVVAGGPAAIDSTPAVADLFKNGHREIVVGVGSTWAPHQQGGVVVFNQDGSTHCRFQTRDMGNIWANTPGGDGYSDAVFSSPAIGDINGDGYPDIVFGAFDLHVYAIDRNCHVILDDNVEDSTWSSPALYDANGDGRLDILIGSDQAAGGAINWSGGEFRAIAWSPSGPVELWKRQIGDTVWSSPAIGDIDGDGRVEVVVGAGNYYNREDGHRVYAWHADDGSTVPGWPVTTAGSTMPSPALGDLNGDGRVDVVVSSGDGWERAYRGNGSLLWATHLWAFADHQPGGATASPIVADMNGDGRLDVGVGNNFAYFLLNGVNGGVLATVNTYMSFEAAGAVGYFGSGGWKLITVGFNTPNHFTRIQAFNLATPKTAATWPMFHRDPAHRAGPLGSNLLPPGYCARSKNPPAHPSSLSSAGYWVASTDGSIFAMKGAPYYGNANGRARWAVGLAPTHSGRGYYVLDSTGSIFTFGDAHSFGSMAGHFLVAPIIALAPTPSGHGYWLLARDGGVFSFGDARFWGSMGGHHLNAPIISMAATRTGRGYWLLASDGGVFSFGDARFHGSTGGMRLAAPVLSMATAPSGRGYWLIAKDGGIFSFGVPFYGSIPGIGLCHGAPGAQIRPTLTGGGYFVLASDGRVFTFGDAAGGGSTPHLPAYVFATDLAVRP